MVDTIPSWNPRGLEFGVQRAWYRTETIVLLVSWKYVCDSPDRKPKHSLRLELFQVWLY